MVARILVFAALMVVTCAGAVEAQRSAEPDPDYARLMQQYQAAQTKYYEPYEKAKTDAERNKIQLDPRKNPIRAFLPRFQALAARKKGTDAGAEALMWVVQYGGQTGRNEAVTAALNELARAYITSPVMEQVVRQLSYIGAGPADPPGVVKAVLAKSPHSTVRAAALYALAEGYGSPYGSWKKDPVSARTYLIQLKSRYPATEYAKRADNYLFELDNLQIGKVAPDFAATDETGKEFKLSDYRGKVVVLDFWGFW